MILLKNKNAKPSEIKGNYINIKDGYKTQLQKLVLDGRSTQETTTGKNLFNIYSNHQKGSTDTSQPSGVQVRYNEDGSITLNGTATKNSDIVLDNSFKIKYENGKDYYMLIEYLGGSRTLGENALFNVAYISYDGTYHYINIDVPTSGNIVAKLITYTNQQYFGQIRLFQKNSGNVYNNFRIRISVMNDSNQSYEPYTGGIPSPNPNYPSEIESIEGKNLCDISTSQIGVGWNLTTNSARAICNVKVEPNTTYSLSFASISGIDGLYFCEKVNSTDTTIIGNIVRITTNRQITTSSTTNYLVILFNKSNISMSDIEAIKLQVEKGSIITGYVPYNTIQYKQIGKNLFNSALVQNMTRSGVTWLVQDDGGINISGSNTSTGNVSNSLGRWSSTEPIIELDPTKTYTLSFSGNYVPAKVQFECRGLKNDAISTISSTLSRNTTITGFSAITYLNFYARVGATDINETIYLMIAEGSDTNFKKYEETILNINLQGNKLCSLSNGVKDELIVENGRAKIIKNVQEDLLDGVNEKFYSIDLRESKTFLTCNYANTNIKKATSENEVIPLSNKFRPTSIYNTLNGVVIYGISQAPNGHYLQFLFPKTISADLTLDGLNAWLVNNNTKVQYQLETPIEIDLGEVTTPKTFEGVNNISNSEDTNMLINYYNAFEFDKILRSGYEIDEQENEIFKKKMANGHRKKIVSSYIDCIIKINLGLLDNKTYQEYKGQLEDGEYEYWSYKYNQYKKANFILTKPSITTEYAYDDEIGIDDMKITLEKSSDVS